MMRARIVAAVGAVGLAITASGGVAQAASSHASCVAVITSAEASGLPPGSVGGEVSSIATGAPGAAGGLVSDLAGEHAGTLDACRAIES